ncbi:MAG: class I SAM-dependent methyltransferase [Dehalococcoidales bacterium]|nr:MAG: class I SAM-dependent methyltransferase [Dehalococcoidales bacterium]
MERPESLENRWDILYREYPEVYDEFATTSRKPTNAEVLHKMFNFKDRVVLDIGSGTGASTFGVAAYAKYVIGIEPGDAMLGIAMKKLKGKPNANVEFIKGKAQGIPLKDGTVDSVIADFAGPIQPDVIKGFVKDAIRVIRKNGFFATVTLPPKGWYGGELQRIIVDRSEPPSADEFGIPLHRTYQEDLGFEHKDFYQIQEYGSVEKIVAVYGFIYGR